MVKENLELKYFYSISVFLTTANKALSTDTYWVYFALFLSSSFFFSSSDNYDIIIYTFVFDD